MLNSEEEKFLSRLDKSGKITKQIDLPPGSYRPQDKARKKASKKGWAIFDRKEWGWKITNEGLKILKENKEKDLCSNQ